MYWGNFLGETGCARSLTSKADLCRRAEEKTLNASDTSNELKAL